MATDPESKDDILVIYPNHTVPYSNSVRIGDTDLDLRQNLYGKFIEWRPCRKLECCRCMRTRSMEVFGIGGLVREGPKGCEREGVFAEPVDCKGYGERGAFQFSFLDYSRGKDLGVNPSFFETQICTFSKR